MRLIKLALISFIFLFGMITVFSLFIPSQIRISRAIDIHAHADSILPLVADKNNWPDWHPAYQQANDTAQAQWVKATAWKKLVHSDSLVVIELHPSGKKPIINGWRLYSFNNSYTLQWYMDFRFSWYPWQKFSSLFYEGTYGKMMEKGLNNLKSQVEK